MPSGALLLLVYGLSSVEAMHVTVAGKIGRRSAPPRCALAEERAESGKAAVIAALSGSACAAPAALLASTAFTPQWEFATDTLVVQCLLFGVVYRYAVRSDDSEQLKQGAVGAFAVCRTLNCVQVGAQCTAVPLNCGPPLGYLDWDMLVQLSVIRSRRQPERARPCRALTHRIVSRRTLASRRSHLGAPQPRSSCAGRRAGRHGCLLRGCQRRMSKPGRADPRFAHLNDSTPGGREGQEHPRPRTGYSDSHRDTAFQVVGYAKRNSLSREKNRETERRDRRLSLPVRPRRRLRL
jgi:hypothetical protein